MCGKCALCLKHKRIVDSHIIPKFVFRWLKNASATRYLRSGKTPNKRAQDGIKIPLLCINCEKRFCKLEDHFKRKFFNKIVNNKIHKKRINYDHKDYLFLLTLSWRMLKYFELKNGFKNYSRKSMKNIKQSEAAWRNILQNSNKQPNNSKHYCYLFYNCKIKSSRNLPENLYRYIERNPDGDVCKHNNSILVYTKLPKLIVISLINPQLNSFDNEIVEKGGLLLLEPNMPDKLCDIICRRAKATANLQENISDKQKHKIQNDYKKIPLDEIINTEVFKSLDKDVRQFGEKRVFKSNPENPNNSKE